jgi:hypothetical protein
LEALLKATSELLATVLRGLGFVGQTRRRASISNDLRLLRSVARTEGFGPGSEAHQALVTHIGLEINKYTGARREWRKREWGTIVLLAILGGGFGYLTYFLNEGGFAWYSIPAGIVAGVMFLALMVALFDPPAGKEDQPTAAARKAASERASEAP